MTDIPRPCATIMVGTAGWAIPRAHAARFVGSGPHLQRYGCVLPATEINSTFYRVHKPATFARWAASVPPGFRFAVKMPRDITHVRKLAGADALLRSFLEDIAALGNALGPVLVQLPPKLAFDAEQASNFFGSMRALFAGDVVCEPRHVGWFTTQADAVLRHARVARCAADPAVTPDAGRPGGWNGLAYYRLHGSPLIYKSSYDRRQLDTIALRLRQHAAAAVPAWCIFDNTMVGAASDNALDVWARCLLLE